jgi:hypothetical protein
MFSETIRAHRHAAPSARPMTVRLPDSSPALPHGPQILAARPWPSNLTLHLALVPLSSALVGMFLWMLGFGQSLGSDVIYGLAIGSATAGLSHLAYRLAPRGLARWLLVPFALLLGATLGLLFGDLVTGQAALSDPYFVRSELIGLFFGGIGTVVMVLRERQRELQVQLKVQELRRLEADKRSLEAQLRLLQAQIEPHFLFNTLANVADLIQASPDLAKRLVDALGRYLRANLKRTRAEDGTLGDELDLLAAYLEVLQIRLGPRLAFAIQVPAALRERPFPPMLLQPLVENAVRHGIEPCVAGGRIEIRAALDQGRLEVQVRDSGAGFGPAPGAGLGLANVRARLAALFGAAGALDILELPEGGVLSLVRLPA